MDLGNATTNLGYGMSRLPYRPNIKINKLHEDAHLPTYGSKTLLVQTCTLILVLMTQRW